MVLIWNFEVVSEKHPVMSTGTSLQVGFIMVIASPEGEDSVYIYNLKYVVCPKSKCIFI